MSAAYENGSIRLAAVVEPKDPIVRDATFRRCKILGPAVILAVGPGQIVNSRFDATEESLFWVPAGPWPNQASGVVVLINCIFDDCDFIGIGIAAEKDELARIKGGFRPKPTGPDESMVLSTPRI